MEYRRIGETDLKCSVITFGAWAIGGWKWGGADRGDAIKAIRSAYHQGVTSIDTAPAYGQGISEEIIAEALEGIPRNKVQILTKFGLRWDSEDGTFFFRSEAEDGRPLNIYKFASKQSIIHECENSLRRLKTDYIDLYQIHWHDPVTPIHETMEALLKLKEQGKIREAGVCNYTAEWMAEAEQTIRLASNQVPYSMIVRDIEKELVPFCIKHRRSIIAYSPLQRGLLTGKMKPGHVFNEGDHRQDLSYFSDENIRRVNILLQPLKQMAEGKKATLTQLVLRWTIEQPGITIALAGARDEKQALENAEAVNVALSADELQFINKHLEALQLVPA